MSKWEWKKLGEVYDFTRGLTYSKKDEVESSSNCILRSNNIDLQTNLINLDELKYIKDEIEIPQEKYVRKNTILICMSNGSKAHLGKVAYIDKDYDFAFGGFMGLLKPKCEINGKFVHLYLCSDEYKNFIKSLSDGANINNLKFDDLRKFEIPFPPLSEQKRIVKFLDEEISKIDTLKTNAETNLKNAKELFETTLEKELNPAKNGTLPSGWEWKTLRELCILRPSKNEALSHLKGTDEVSFLPMEDLNIRERNTIPHKSRALSEVHGSYTFFAEGDVLLAKVTPCFENGKMGIASNLLNGVGFGSSEYIVFRTTKSMINSYLFYVLMSSRFISGGKKQMLGACGLKRLSKEYVESFQIPLPPLSVQKEIVARLDKLSENVKRLEANYKQIIANCDELKKSILKKTFERES